MHMPSTMCVHAYSSVCSRFAFYTSPYVPAAGSGLHVHMYLIHVYMCRQVAAARMSAAASYLGRKAACALYFSHTRRVWSRSSRARSAL